LYVSDGMAASLRRSLPSLRRAFLTPAPARMLSSEASDALVEIKSGEIGMVSGIPEEHLRRRVTFLSS
jgi:NADH dehydrogenase (ubiquinone) Fe-S protein 4